MSRSHTTPGRRAAGRWVRVLGVLAAAAAAMLLTVTSASASQAARIGASSVALRDCYHPSKQAYPSQSCTQQATLPAGTSVTLVCQYQGQNIYGDVWWDYLGTPSGYGYVSDYYVDTYQSAYRVPGVPLCNY